MSPLPTRLYRQDAGIGQLYVCAARRQRDQQFRDPVGGLERALLDQTTRDDLRQARRKTATGSLAHVMSPACELGMACTDAKEVCLR